MAGRQINDDFTLDVASGQTVSNYRLCKLSGNDALHCSATATDVPIGVSQPGTPGITTQVTLRDIKRPGLTKITAAGVIAEGAAAYAAAAGKVQALPGVGGTYLKIGVAIDAAAADGDIIGVWVDPSRTTTNV